MERDRRSFSQPLDEVADYDDEEDPLPVEDEYADQEELRDSLFRQLADLRPEVGELLSEPQPRQKLNRGTK